MWKDVQGPAGSTGATILIGDIVRLSQAWAKSVVVKGFTMKKTHHDAKLLFLGISSMQYR